MIYHQGNYDLEGLQETVAQAVLDLKKSRKQFDSIVVTGVSGLVVGAPVALALDKPLVIIRKPEKQEPSHSYGQPVNVVKLGKYALFLDDFVSLGNTKKRVREAVELAGGVLVGDYLYASTRNADDVGSPELVWAEPRPEPKPKPRKRKPPVVTIDPDAVPF